MKRYIDANKLIDDLNYSTQNTWGKGLGYSWWSHSVKLKDNMVECINDQPTADVEEVRHGEWIETYRGLCPREKVIVCSLCGRVEEQKEPYCNCGAKMNGSKTE